jgi:hypothetical protein
LPRSTARRASISSRTTRSSTSLISWSGIARSSCGDMPCPGLWFVARGFRRAGRPPRRSDRDRRAV